jgi:O-antigen ligase
MTFRIAHIVDTFMVVILFCIALNGLNFMYHLKGITITSPLMSCTCFIGVYLLWQSPAIPNLSYQLWTLFSVIYFVIAYSVYFIYHEIHPKIDFVYTIRTYFYNFIIIIVIYRYVLFCIHRNRFEWLINLLSIIFILGSLTVIFAIPLGFYTFQYVNQPPYISFDRFAGIYFNPNTAGFIANITTILGLATLLRQNSPKILGIIGVLVGVITMVFSFSKTAILIFVVLLLLMAGIYFSMYRKIDRTTRRIANVFFILILYGLVQLGILISVFFSDLTRNQQERITQIETILSGKGDKSSTSNRAELAELGLRKISDRPILGSGLFSFVQLLEAGKETGDDVGVHNIFLRVWGEAGILPFLLFMAFFGASFWYAFLIPTAWLRFLTTGLLFTLAFFGSTNHNVLEDNICGLITSLICGCLIAQSTSKTDVSAL